MIALAHMKFKITRQAGIRRGGANFHRSASFIAGWLDLPPAAVYGVLVIMLMTRGPAGTGMHGPVKLIVLGNKTICLKKTPKAVKRINLSTAFSPGCRVGNNILHQRPVNRR